MTRRADRWLFLILHRLALPVSIGVRDAVLRPLLTPASPARSCDRAFRPFKRALLAGANDGPQAAWQVSPDKNVVCRCTSSSFTCAVVWERLRDVVLTRLTSPALYDVSVRSLAALVRRRPGGEQQTRRLRTSSQASSPRPVARAQLPSPRTLTIGAIIWYADLLESPSLVHGTFTR